MKVNWVGVPCRTLPLNFRESVGVSQADYPAQWQRIARTRDGIDYRIRPIRIEDAERDRAFIIHLSEASRYKRMMGSVREPSQELIDRFVRIDYRHDMAFVAVVDQPGAERIIGVARYGAGSDKTDAEFAVAVADEWQSRGIGMTLLRLLFEYAKGQGVRRLHALIFANNDRMLDLARKLQLKIGSWPDDPSVLEAAGDL
jgi:acetyltransferase